MIDWPLILASAVWLGGAALALATLSYASWLASLRGERLRAILQQSRYQQLLLAAAGLFCAGMGLTAVTWLETVLWLLLASLSLISLWRKVRRKKTL